MNLHHLQLCRAVHFPSSSMGLCFHWSTALCLDIAGSEIVIGTLAGATVEEAIANPNATFDPFLHAWVEYHGRVFAPTTIKVFGGLSPMNRAEYYATNGIADTLRLSQSQLLEAFKGLGLVAHLTRRAPLRKGVRFVPRLLAKAGVAWMDDGAGGVVPKVAA